MTLPSIPDDFEWTGHAWGTALRCRPLAAVAPHLFTTRQLALSSLDDWAHVAEALGATDVATLTQVHGRAVVAVRPGSRRPGLGLEGDVLVSDDPSTAVAIRAADCVPLLIADRATGAVAAVHAGWRGTAAGAAAAAVDALAREFGAHPADLVAAIGPAIGPCCYEVGVELVEAFAAAGHERFDLARWFSTPAGAIKPRLDTWAANRDQLQRAGLRAASIHVAGLCTACNADLFPSFRREKEKAGRMAGAIRARRA